MAKKGGLGKGLDAIFYDNAREDDAGAVELSINAAFFFVPEICTTRFKTSRSASSASS